jgi:hypothetical protein
MTKTEMYCLSLVDWLAELFSPTGNSLPNQSFTASPFTGLTHHHHTRKKDGASLAENAN